MESSTDLLRMPLIERARRGAGRWPAAARGMRLPTELMPFALTVAVGIAAGQGAVALT